MKIKLLSTVDSTNNYLRQLAATKEVEEGTVVVSLEQTAGRGQRGHSWVSERGMGLYFSILLRPRGCPAEAQFILNKVIAAGAARYVDAASGCRTEIRWPNDLLLEGRKAGGILIENTLRGNHLAEVIAGIGINLNQESFTGSFQTPPVSLHQLSGTFYDPGREADALYGMLMKAYQSWQNGVYGEIVEYYNNRLYGRGRTVRFLTADGTFSDALFEGVDETGRAMIIENGLRKKVSHPEFRINGMKAPD